MAKLKKGSRITGEARQAVAGDITKEYADGKSIRDIAAASGRSYGFVHRILSERGTALRGRGGRRVKVSAGHS